MSEQRSLIAAARSQRERGEPIWIATVVDVHGSSYRRPGARMLFTAERWLAGSVSDGCLERDVVPKLPELSARSGSGEVGYGQASGAGEP